MYVQPNTLNYINFQEINKSPVPRRQVSAKMKQPQITYKLQLLVLIQSY